MGWVCVTGLVYNFVAHPLLLRLVAAGGLTETSSPLLHDTLKDWSAYPNFSKSEFDCRHCGANAMQPGFMTQLQALRERFGKPMRITSGYRCTAHPIEAKKIGAGPHTTGLACDVGVERAEAHRLLGLAIQLGYRSIGVQQKSLGELFAPRLGDGVILPFLTGIGSRVHAAMANRCFGVIPPKAIFGRS